MLLVVDHPRDHVGFADGELVTFPPHHLDEDGQLELAASRDFEGLGGSGVFHPDGDVAQGLFVEALLDLAGGQVLAFEAGERRIVDAE